MHLLIFDSGIGGLGVVREIRRLQPAARLTYLADNAGFPYGEKPDDVLLHRILALLNDAIAKHRPDALVVACNTASTIALAQLRAAQTLPIIGCVPPVKPAAAASRNRRIGVLATAATVRREYLADLIARFAPDCAVHRLGTPSLAELAERKFRGEQVDIGPAVAPLFEGEGAAIDAVALGCTHYTFLLDEFRARYPGIAWFDPAQPVARQTLAVTASLQGSDMPGEEIAIFTAGLPDLPEMRRRLAAYGFGALRAG
ncbi:MAG: glutamate racemase [Rhodospirillales bacterium 20-64-7]|nr:MAG: glutamate racemase [Rhodospirillales bacterium 20-64-7]